MPYDDFSLKLGAAIARRYGADELKSIWTEAETGVTPPTATQDAPSTGPRLTRKALMANTQQYADFFERERAEGRNPLESFRQLPRE